MLLPVFDFYRNGNVQHVLFLSAFFFFFLAQWSACEIPFLVVADSFMIRSHCCVERRRYVKLGWEGGG